MFEDLTAAFVYLETAGRSTYQLHTYRPFNNYEEVVISKKM